MKRKWLDQPPVVIGGCGRSGTTLLLSILSAHPAIHAFPDETGMLCRGGYSSRVVDLGVPRPRVLDARARAEAGPGARRWCEKSPKNVLFFRPIMRRIRGVRILNVVRDGRDVVTSVYPERPSSSPVTYRRLVRNATEQGGYHVPVSRWVADVTAGLRAARYPQVLTIRYEDIVQDYEATLRRVCAHVGEPFAPELLDYPASAKVNTSPAWATVSAKPVSDDRVGRWARPEHEGRVAEFMSDPRAVTLLRELGYADVREPVLA